MKDRRVVCLFCRHSLTPRAPLQTTQRWITTRQREPYVLPRLIIDLDAADNAQVKQFEDLPKDEQNRNLKGYKNKRNSDGKGKFIKYVKPKTPPSWHKFDLDRNFATPTDLLSYALMGESDNSFIAKRDRGRIYQKVGIYPQDGVLRKVQEVTSTFIVDDAARFKKSRFRFDQEHIESLRERIENCYSMDNLQLLISMFSSTKEGCECLAQNGDVISASIRLCRRRQGEIAGTGVPASRVLRLLNNLHRNMESKGVEMGAALCNRGLYYAAKVGSLPAIKMYLDMAQRNSYELDFYGNQTPSELLVSYLESENSSVSQTHKEDFLAILTGYPSGLPTEGSEQTFSIRALLNDRQSHKNMFYRKYLFTVAQLGLTDTLWAEWNAVLSNTDRRLSDRYKIQRANCFALAFSIAGDSGRALSIFSTLLQNAEMERQPPSHSARNEANGLRSMIYDHYKCRNLEASPEFWQRVGLELQNIPQQPKQALEVLERYLVSDYQRGVQKRRVELRVVEGKEVLMVFPLREGRPLFAKILGNVEKESMEGAESVQGSV